MTPNLKNHCLFIFLFVNTLFSQTEFKKGAFISNTDETVECLIKDLDWKNNPNKFKYKLTEDGDVKDGDILDVKSFEIYGVSKFLRAIVAIDRSNSNIDNLSEKRGPEFSEEQLFLRELVPGKATLYYFEAANFVRFFYNLEDEKITQLVFKKYLFDNSRIGENNHFRQQILNVFDCEDLSVSDIKRLDYNIEDLTNIFKKYNSCVSGDIEADYDEKTNKDIFNFRVKVGIGSATLDIETSSLNKKFDNEFMYRFGGELEVLLPFNNDKWALLIEPSYQTYTYEEDTGLGLDYKTIEIPFGIRHYFYLNDDSKIFINAFYALIFQKDSSFSMPNLELDMSNGQSVGIGYSFKKLSLEGRYEFSRDLLRNYHYMNADYNQIALILGYQIF